MPVSLSQWKLLALILAFFGPLFIAMMIYFNPHWFASPTPRSHGELITSAQPLTDLAAVSYAEQPLPPDLLRGKWTLLYWNTAVCNLDCEADLFKMRQVRLSLSKDIERTQTMYLSDTLLPSAALKRHPKLITAYLTPNPDSIFRRRLSNLPAGNTYLIDPLGNLVMRYSPDATSKGMLKDLKKLLRISRIG